MPFHRPLKICPKPASIDDMKTKKPFQKSIHNVSPKQQLFVSFSPAVHFHLPFFFCCARYSSTARPFYFFLIALCDSRTLYLDYGCDKLIKLKEEKSVLWAKCMQMKNPVFVLRNPLPCRNRLFLHHSTDRLYHLHKQCMYHLRY